MVRGAFMIPEQIDKELDCMDMICPLPVLRTKKALADMQTGQVLRIKANDRGAEQDIPMFAKQTGNELISTEKHQDYFTFYLKRR
jgi:tRNA 2-thiouridine synthesizing protein A